MDGLFVETKPSELELTIWFETKPGKAMAVSWQSTAQTARMVGRGQAGVGGGHNVKAAGPGGQFKP